MVGCPGWLVGVLENISSFYKGKYFKYFSNENIYNYGKYFIIIIIISTHPHTRFPFAVNILEQFFLNNILRNPYIYYSPLCLAALLYSVRCLRTHHSRRGNDSFFATWRAESGMSLLSLSTYVHMACVWLGLGKAIYNYEEWGMMSSGLDWNECEEEFTLCFDLTSQHFEQIKSWTFSDYISKRIEVESSNSR